MYYWIVCLTNLTQVDAYFMKKCRQTIPCHWTRKTLLVFFLLTDSRRSHLVLIGENWLVKIGWAWHVMTGLGTPGICTYWPLSRKQPFWHFLTLSSCWIPSTKKKQPNLPCGKTHLTQSSWPNKVPKNKWPRPPGHSWHKGDFTYETH